MIKTNSTDSTTACV